MVAAAARQRGAALFVVLLFAAFLGGLAAAAMRTGLSGSRAAAVFADSMRAEELGRSAGDVLAYHLLTGSDAALRGGSIAVRLPGSDIVIDYVSESARVDVNLAPIPLLSALIGAAGAEPAEVDAIVDRITRFRADAARRAEAAKSARAPANALEVLQRSIEAAAPAGSVAEPPLALHDLAEVGEAWGLGETLARKLMPALTVSNGAPQVDPVLAGRLVVLALTGSDERTDDYLQRRRQGFASKDSALLLLPVPARTFATFKDSPAIRALARVTVARRLERRYEMVLAPPVRDPGTVPQGRAAAPVVVSWRRLL